ncbi:MAG TPA: porin family protein [Puia sp.]|nr:porin family protein [Puia sp.]
MKRNAVVLSFLLAIAAASPTHAQGFHLGVKAGANLFKIDGESFSQQFQFGYTAGAFTQIYVSRSWGLQPELNFNQTDYRTGNNFSAVVPDGVNDVRGKLDWLTVPVLLSYRPVPVLSLLAGPQFGILVNQDQHLINNAGDAFRKGDLSIVAGAQLNLGPVMAGARYQIGLSNINDVTNESTWKNQGWQIYTGFRIF